MTTKGAPQPRVQTPTYTRVECLNLNANTHTAAVIFHRGARWKNSHTHKPIVRNKRERVGLTFPIASVDVLYCRYEKLSLVIPTEFYTECIYTHETEHYRGRYNIMVSSICVFASYGPTRIYTRIYIFQRLWCRSAASETGKFSGRQRQRGIRVEKCLFLRGKGRVIGAYRWICIYNRTRVFGWGRGFRRPFAICRAYAYTYIIIYYFLRANTRDLYAYISSSNKKWN